MTQIILFYFLAEGVADADLVLLVTTRPTTGNTLAWAVACERDQWGRAIAGKYVWASFLTRILIIIDNFQIFFQKAKKETRGANLNHKAT